MNAPILRLFGVFLVLFAALVAFTSYNSVINADAYRDNPKNKRAVIEQQRIRRGLIRVRGGELIARSQQGEAGIWRRQYPAGAELFSHVLGYSYTGVGNAGVERSRNDELVGARNELTSVLDQLRGKRQEGDNLALTVDPKAQKVAQDALNGRKGAVVALEPKTGRVRVMVSTPTYNPNAVDDVRRFRELNRDEENAPLINRATQNGYPPGSTMKVVTATAGIDSGKFTPSSTLNGNSPQTFSTKPLNNFGSTSWGQTTLTNALTNSINTVWAQVAVQVGSKTMSRYMRRFGFFSDPPMDYPDGQMSPSGVLGSDGEQIDVGDGETDIARVGIGQERLRVTPLQMAMVASSVANGGVLMKPHLTDRIVDRDGRTVNDIEPSEQGRVMKTSTARQLTAMMKQVVKEGTGTAAALRGGIEVAGKTGTAEIDIERRINQPWFIGFAPADDPKIAVAVTIERLQGGQGGVDAAPIAQKVFQQLVGRQ